MAARQFIRLPACRIKLGTARAQQPRGWQSTTPKFSHFQRFGVLPIYQRLPNRLRECLPWGLLIKVQMNTEHTLVQAFADGRAGV